MSMLALPLDVMMHLLYMTHMYCCPRTRRECILAQ